MPNVKIQIPNECQMLEFQNRNFSIREHITAVSNARGSRLTHETVHFVTPACSWRGSRELEEPGFPPGACGNDDQSRAPTVFKKLPDGHGAARINPNQIVNHRKNSNGLDPRRSVFICGWFLYFLLSCLRAHVLLLLRDSSIAAPPGEKATPHLPAAHCETHPALTGARSSFSIP